jgi:hypothetical protein
VETYLTEASIRQWQLENAPSNENNNLWWQANLLPLSAPSVLVVTNEAQATTEVLSALYGYSQKQLSVLSASALCEPSENGEQVAAAVVNIDIHALANDPVKWLCQLNTRLALGATAIVSLAISGIEPSMHALDRASMQSYMEAAGFSVEKTVAGPLDIDMNMKAEQHNEQWVFALTKRSWMANINPPAYNNGVSELKWLVTHLEAGS